MFATHSLIDENMCMHIHVHGCVCIVDVYDVLLNLSLCTHCTRNLHVWWNY